MPVSGVAAVPIAEVADYLRDARLGDPARDRRPAALLLADA
jgi:hypothetical protein